jgi:HK97 family phage major capsid protein
MKLSIELMDKIAKKNDEVKALIAENRVEDARKIEGYVDRMNEDLRAEIEHEDSERERMIRDTKPVSMAKAASIGAQILGDKAAFGEFAINDKHTAVFCDALATLATPQTYSTDLPAPAFAPSGFLSTIPHGTTDAVINYFKQGAMVSGAAEWLTEGTTKPESAISWTPATANLPVIAHWIPVAKQATRRYAQLEGLINNSLMMGLSMKEDALALLGSNTNGIIGIKNQSGVLVHTKVAGDNIKDTLATMRRKARIASGFAPNYVALSPVGIENLSKAKDSTGRYLFPDIADGGTISGMTVVEDTNMSISTTVNSVTTVTEGALVYFAPAAEWDVADPAEVTIGLTGEQFVQNAYTMLAETSAAFQVPYPAAFCICTDITPAA